MARKRTNPLARAGWAVLFAGFGYLGLTFGAGLEDALGPYVSHVIFSCCCFALVWLYFQVQTGEIHMPSQSGAIYRYTRKKEPIMFFIVSGMIGLMALSLVIFLGSDIFLGCEGSLINPCRPD